MNEDHIIVVTNIYDIGGKLRKIRQRKKISGRKLAKIIGCSEQTIYRGERGEWLPTLETLTAWIEVLGYSQLVIVCSGYGRKKVQTDE